MEGDDAGTRRGEVRHDAVNRFHHQVNVDRGGNAIVTQRLEHHRTDGQVWNVVVIHHVEMDDIRASRQCVGSVFTQAGKIGRQN